MRTDQRWTKEPPVKGEFIHVPQLHVFGIVMDVFTYSDRAITVILQEDPDHDLPRQWNEYTLEKGTWEVAA